MNLLERIRQFWGRPPAPDHPLSEQERDEHHPTSTYDELARTATEFVGDDFDPDARKETD